VDQNRTLSYITIDWQQGTYSNVQTLDLRDNNGQLIRWANAAISKNGRLLALVPNEQVPILVLFDLATSQSKAFELYNPTYSQTQTNTNTVVSADALEFDHAGETIIYDAFNRLDGTGGFNEEYWDINIIDVWDNRTEQFTEGNIIPLFAALPENVSIGNPTYSKNATGVLAFDYIEEDFFSDTYALLAMDLSKSQTSTVYLNDRLSFPTYSNSDDVILFDASDQFGQDVIGHIAMQENRIEPSENPFVFQSGYWPVWFANGNRPLVNAASQDLQARLLLAPNPAHDWVQIKGLALDQIQSIQIFSMDGKAVSNWNWERSDNRINVRQLRPGMYWIVVSSPKGVQQSSFIKQ
jgi:hypothetical protein